MTSAARSVQTARREPLLAHPGAYEAQGELTPSQRLQAFLGCPAGEARVKGFSPFPPLPAFHLDPGCHGIAEDIEGHNGSLKAADVVVAVRAIEVTHVSYLHSLVSQNEGATPPSVTAKNPLEIKGVTRGTRNYRFGLRARARRASNESCVPNVISRLTSDVKTRNYNYQLHCGRTHSRRHLAKLASLASLGLKGLEK